MGFYAKYRSGDVKSYYANLSQNRENIPTQPDVESQQEKGDAIERVTNITTQEDFFPDASEGFKAPSNLHSDKTTGAPMIVPQQSTCSLLREYYNQIDRH